VSAVIQLIQTEWAYLVQNENTHRLNVDQVNASDVPTIHFCVKMRCNSPQKLIDSSLPFKFLFVIWFGVVNYLICYSSRPVDCLHNIGNS
jgi:hypothetical protein